MEYKVYEYTGEKIDTQPSHDPHANYIGSVEAESLPEARDIAHEEYGAPIGVE